jgi:perosamine synthetase
MSRIYYTKPSITKLEIRYATDAATHGWGERCYEYITRFEQAFCDHLGVRHAIATSSCTGAMHMGLAALGIGSGDEVILGDINWIASAAPITYLGATPVLVDVLHALLTIGERHGIPVIEDAAEAIGSCWHGRRAGAIGTFGTFSFHGTKTLTTGEGGMFVTQDDALYEKVLGLSNHGRVRGQSKQFWPDMLGFKYKMSNIQAAIGCAQLERIDELIAAKRRIFQYYQTQLAGLPLTMNPEHAGTVNGFWMPTIVATAEAAFSRDALLEEFKRGEIDGRMFFWPLSMLPMFSPQPENRISYGLFERALNLPSYHDIAEHEMARVVHCVRRFLTAVA